MMTFLLLCSVATPPLVVYLVARCDKRQEEKDRQRKALATPRLDEGDPMKEGLIQLDALMAEHFAEPREKVAEVKRLIDKPSTLQ